MQILNNLPVIIDQPGKYRMRNGGIVTIDRISPQCNERTTAFRAKGYYKIKKLSYSNAWHVSGRLYPLEISKYDIVSKL